MKWEASDIPDQSGRVAVVTGANSGLGYVTARELAAHGARVVLACRDAGRGGEALRRLTAAVPGAQAELRSLDLSSLASVRAFADEVLTAYDGVDLLINNAGVMAIGRDVTVDGYERQFATNHLGHFALTGLLLPRIANRPGARIVSVSSNGHKMGGLNFDDLQSEKRYFRWRVYGNTKLANLLFAYELQRRLAAAGSPAISVAAHPGTAATNLVVPTAGNNPILRAVYKTGVRLIGQSDEQGALPQLYAATAPDVQGGQYFGPDRLANTVGHPSLQRSNGTSYDEATARRLWEASEQLTGVTYDFAAALPRR